MCGVFLPNLKNLKTPGEYGTQNQSVTEFLSLAHLLISQTQQYQVKCIYLQLFKAYYSTIEANKTPELVLAVFR